MSGDPFSNTSTRNLLEHIFVPTIVNTPNGYAVEMNITNVSNIGVRDVQIDAIGGSDNQVNQLWVNNVGSEEVPSTQIWTETLGSENTKVNQIWATTIGETGNRVEDIWVNTIHFLETDPIITGGGTGGYIPSALRGPTGPAGPPLKSAAAGSRLRRSRICR